jgi:hypothetical protein
MLAVKSIAEEILDLKRDRRAVILAHHYQESEIQELADVVGDSLELARRARNLRAAEIRWKNCGNAWTTCSRVSSSKPISSSEPQFPLNACSR